MTGVRLCIILVAVLVVWVVGCSNDDSEEDIAEVFTGEVTVDIEPSIVGRVFTDTVRLTITGREYRFETMDTAFTNNPPLCDSRGEVSGFGRMSATFTPRSIDTTGTCDAKHTLQGTFPTVFKGDSLIMVRTGEVQGDTVSYDFRLSL